MDFRQLFTNGTWWGKLIGAFFGYLIAGSTGALFGIIIGNFFDRGLSSHFSHPFWPYQHEKNPEIQRAFFESTFALLGHLAKADGQVSQQDIQYTIDIMAQMKLNAKQKKLAQNWFYQGKSAQFNLPLTLHNLYKNIRQRPILIRLFVNTQYQFVKQSELTEKKIEILNQILSHLQLAPLYQHYQFAQDFPWYGRWQHQDSSQNKQQYSDQKQPPPSYHTSHEDPYTLLKVSPTASQADIKRAYRRQMSHYHPDKLIAKGASASTIKAATEKTQQIRKAYETICQWKGW
ncbi:MAG: co-chaperone DjlA [Legionella sp.]|nr:MAG: co-chaperone DjlA [Legionella sp.]